MASKRPSFLMAGVASQPQAPAPASAGGAQTVGAPAAGASGQASAAAPRPTNTQIADRAMAIWRARGCPVGRDVEIWLEAEAQLKRELGNN